MLIICTTTPDFFNLDSIPLKVNYWFPCERSHPSKQSDFGRHIANDAKDNDIVVMTYSDHILNGARIAVMLDGAKLEARFYSEPNKCEVIEFDKNARTENWPRYFFDQTSYDLMQLLAPH